MIDTKKLRRLAQEATPGPWKMIPIGDGRQKFAVADSEFLSILTVTDEGGATFGTVYDDADAAFIAAANPAAITELLDRLEAAEKSDAESIAMYRKARDERDELRAAVRHEADCVDAAKAEIKALRAKIEAMLAVLEEPKTKAQHIEQALNMAINAGEHLRKHLPNDEFLTEADRMAVVLLEKAKRFERGDEK